MTLYKWSKTAASDATADPTINWAEGQSPSSVNDSARAMMAAVAKYRDDTAGNNMFTGGTSTAYTVSSAQGFDTTGHMVGAEIGLIMHATNGASPTLNVDGLGAFPINTMSGSAVPSGTLIANSVYNLFFNTTEWLLRGFYGNPYNIPVGSSIEYWGASVPNNNFVFPTGQAISRTTYSTLFSLFSTTYGSGDGSTTFNVPDLTGCVPVMKETVADGSRRLSTIYFGDSTGLGNRGGSQSHTLTTAEMPSHSHANTLTDPGHTHNYTDSSGGTKQSGSNSSGGNSTGINATATSSATTGITINNAAQGGGNPHAIVQPTIICNRILRVI